MDFENYYIRSDEDNYMYYSINFTQGIHEIGELKYNRDGKYEVLSTTELFGDKLHIAHITSNIMTAVTSLSKYHTAAVHSMILSPLR